jgi:hypothetical protein
MIRLRIHSRVGVIKVKYQVNGVFYDAIASSVIHKGWCGSSCGFVMCGGDPVTPDPFTIVCPTSHPDDVVIITTSEAVITCVVGEREFIDIYEPCISNWEMG